MRDVTLTDVELIGAFGDADRTFLMTEEAFHAFYEQTSRPVWAYLARITGDGRLADDLLQEAYYRFLRTRAEFESDDHRRNYLFRIATNLVRDRHRRPSREVALPDDDCARPLACEDSAPAQFAVKREVGRALDALRPRDRDLLWLAYTQGLSHAEMARTLGVKTGSVKLLLFRARARLSALLRHSGFGDAGKSKETVS